MHRPSGTGHGIMGSRAYRRLTSPASPPPRSCRLLPDLDYGEDCAIQLVFNGPHNRRRDQFDLSRFC